MKRLIIDLDETITLPATDRHAEAAIHDLLAAEKAGD
jgi:hypothetical protein